MYNVGAKPTLLELKTMKGADGKPLRIVQTIAAGDYMTFGMCLLQDENGDEVVQLTREADLDLDDEYRHCYFVCVEEMA